jgi:hypothetical protein
MGRKVSRGVMIEHEPPLMRHEDKRPPPPGDRVIKGKDGSKYFVEGASGRVTQISGPIPPRR